jgi:heavy metal translocating P-type ATPase
VLFVPLTLVLAGAAWALTGDAVRAVAVLVVATPCPLILAVPVAIVAGLSRAAKRGILIKGGRALEGLARIRSLVLDKTGTLTRGTARIVSITSTGDISEIELLRLAASLDQASKHIIAQTIVSEARARGLHLAVPTSVADTPGEGVTGIVEGRRMAIGGVRFVEAQVPGYEATGLRQLKTVGAVVVAVAIDGAVAGALVLADDLRDGTNEFLQDLRQHGVDHVVLATGDRRDVAETVTAGLPIDAVMAELAPGDKVTVVLSERKTGPVMMVGDGVNDAPALAAADVGVAMGARGAAASAEAADVVLLVDDLGRLATAIKIARRSRNIALQSVYAGIGLSVLGMVAAAFGYLAPVEGAVFQEIIDVAVILNALRALSGGREDAAVKGKRIAA